MSAARDELRASRAALDGACGALVSLIGRLAESGALDEHENDADAVEAVCLYLARARRAIDAADAALDAGGMP